MDALHAVDVYPGVHYVENTQYRMYAYAAGTCPNATYISDHILSLPMHMRLTHEDVQLIIDTVVKYVTK